jgi:hypothetical protein
MPAQHHTLVHGVRPPPVKRPSGSYVAAPMSYLTVQIKVLLLSEQHRLAYPWPILASLAQREDTAGALQHLNQLEHRHIRPHENAPVPSYSVCSPLILCRLSRCVPHGCHGKPNGQQCCLTQRRGPLRPICRFQPPVSTRASS